MTGPPFLHPELEPKLNELTGRIVDAVGYVRRELGAGLLESVYGAALVLELRARGLAVETEVRIPIVYRGELLRTPLRVDIRVEGTVIVEVKAVESLHPQHFAQLLTYLRLSGSPVGLLVNFNAIPLASGIHRRVYTHA